MREKTAVDTALAFAGPVLFVGWVMSLVVLRQLPGWLQSALLIFFVTATYAVGGIAQARADNRLDEVQLAAVRFGARWGLMAGVAFIVILIFLPPFQTLLTGTAAVLDGFNGYPRPVESRMFLLGVVSTFVVQEAFRSLLAAGWTWSKR